MGCSTRLLEGDGHSENTMPKGCQFDHRLSFRRLPLGAFGKQDQDYDHDVFNSAGYTLARPHFGLENGVHLKEAATSPPLGGRGGSRTRAGEGAWP